MAIAFAAAPRMWKCSLSLAAQGSRLTTLEVDGRPDWPDRMSRRHAFPDINEHVVESTHPAPERPIGELSGALSSPTGNQPLRLAKLT